MAAGLVEDDAAEAARDDHGHLARGAVGRGEHRDGGGGGAPAHLRGIDALREQLKAHARAGVLAAGLVFGAVAGDGGAHQPRIHARIAHIQALAVGDEHMLLARKHARRHLLDGRGDGPGSGIRGAQHGSALLRGDVERQALHRVDVGHGVLAQRHVAAGAPAVGDGRRGLLRRAQQARERHVAGVDVDGAQVVIDADARATRTADRRVLDAAGAQGHPKVFGVLKKDFGECAAARERAGEHLLALAFADHAQPPLPVSDVSSIRHFRKKVN